jgi:hypothetical protein
MKSCWYCLILSFTKTLSAILNTWRKVKTHVACNQQMNGFLQNSNKYLHFKEATRNCYFVKQLQMILVPLSESESPLSTTSAWMTVRTGSVVLFCKRVVSPWKFYIITVARGLDNIGGQWCSEQVTTKKALVHPKDMPITEECWLPSKCISWRQLYFGTQCTAFIHI